MPRPKKCRRVCKMPRCRQFIPQGGRADGQICMTVDEYETIRLMDHLGYTQVECARQMGVSRPTVTGIYESARRKLAAFLVEGRSLSIEGGNYRLCPMVAHGCGKGGGCPKKAAAHRGEE